MNRFFLLSISHFIAPKIAMLLLSVAPEVNITSEGLTFNIEEIVSLDSSTKLLTSYPIECEDDGLE